MTNEPWSTDVILCNHPEYGGYCTEPECDNYYLLFWGDDDNDYYDDPDAYHDARVDREMEVP
jgi:hypothetical protein